MADGMLHGLTVLVAGTGPGLGREIATVVVREGGRAVLGARTESKLRAVAEEVDPSGTQVTWKVVDITDPSDCEAFVDHAAERFGHVDALVNVAALDSILGGLHGADFTDLDRTLQVNLYGTLHMAQAAIPHLAQAGGGAIVVIGAQSTLSGAVPQLFYAASKGALISAMRHLACEVGRAGIRINTVMPGWMYGPVVEGYVNGEAARRGVDVDTVLGELTAHMPLGRMATDGDVAETVAFFASPRSQGITGQTLLVNAGEIMQ
jgi:NAD(P)-dependent dehydrogenase (short-subunit alcohol dehydrogenase family)